MCRPYENRGRLSRPRFAGRRHGRRRRRRHSPAARRLVRARLGRAGLRSARAVRQGPEERLRETRFSQPAIFVTNSRSRRRRRGARTRRRQRGPLVRRILQPDASRRRCRSKTRCDSSTSARWRCRRPPSGLPARMSGGARARCRRAARGRRRAARGRGPRPAGELQLARRKSSSAATATRSCAAGESRSAAGAKRVVPLNVSGAWHSALMEPARERLRAVRRARARSSCRAFDVISNVDAQPYRDVDDDQAQL